MKNERDQESNKNGDSKQYAAVDIPPKTAYEKEAINKVVEMYLKALDDLVNVNSLFTMAVFIGLAFATPNQRSLDDRRHCDADPVVAKNLVMFEVLSFALFLVSSLAAKSLKVLLNIYKLSEEFNVKFAARIEFPLLRKYFTTKLWRKTTFLISAGASSLGVLFLTLSMVNVIQIRLGKLSCDSAYAFKSVISLTILVLSALMLYLPPMIYAALANFKSILKTDTQVTQDGAATDAIIKMMSDVL